MHTTNYNVNFLEYDSAYYCSINISKRKLINQEFLRKGSYERLSY